MAAKIIEEYIFWPEELTHPVKGRVTEDESADPKLRYGWDISHHSGGENAAGAYYPSQLDFPTLEEARDRLMVYAKSLSVHHLTPNEFFI